MQASATDCWWRIHGTAGEATVIEVDLRQKAVRESDAFLWLDEHERSRWRRLLAGGPRRRFALCRAALRAVLCEKLACENERLAFDATGHGKPFALVDGAPASISFNVSHSGAHGLIACAPAGRLGVDIEVRTDRQDIDLLSEAVFGPTEQAELASTGGYAKTHLFFRLWTIKEALMKAHGAGFQLDASSFETPLDMLRGARKSKFRLPQLPGVAWRLEDLGNERFAAAIAHELDGAS